MRAADVLQHLQQLLGADAEALVHGQQQVLDGQEVVAQVLLELLGGIEDGVQLSAEARLVAAVGLGQAGDGLVGLVLDHQRCLAELAEHRPDDGVLLARQRGEDVVRRDLRVGVGLGLVDGRGHRLLRLQRPLLRVEGHETSVLRNRKLESWYIKFDVGAEGDTPSVASAGMPSLRPRWPPRRSVSERLAATRARPAPTIVGSWAGGALHLWGWDGEHTALPAALEATFRRPVWPADPLRLGHLATLQVPLPDGRIVRPAAVRLPADRAAAWLQSLPSSGTGNDADSVAWLAAVARLAAATVSAGLITPCVRTERDLPVARWIPIADPVLDGAVAALAAAMPPICRPAADDPTTVGDIHAALVDGVARHRLAAADWRPDLPDQPVSDGDRGAHRVPRPGGP